ncbi:hypothetical protein [Actinocorallia longicatena]|uniref:GH18 domain-containing protein n=1 Tax=Actinocorallia longicatena TaxID=111803 RepID=A0ABP6QLG1_9ACTN
MKWVWRILAFGTGLILLFGVQTWVWWQGDPEAGGTETNALWARHQWVGEAHTEAEYAGFVRLLRQNKITDVYFHAGPFEPDGTIPPGKYAHARELTAAMRRLAPDVRIQAYLGQIRVVEGHGVLDLDDPANRRRMVASAQIMIGLGFDGIHYDLEPIYPGDTAFLGLLDATRKIAPLLSVALEQQTLVDAAQPVLDALLPRSGRFKYPARPTDGYLREVARRVDQVAIMAYDTEMPTESLVGRHFAWHTEHTLRVIGDRVTVFIGVPTYPALFDWSETLPVAVRGVRKGLDALGRAPAKPFGLGVYADWTTSEADWADYRRVWPPHAR